MNKKAKLVSLVISMIMGITAYALAWAWFNWKLALVLFLAFWSHNIAARAEKEEGL